MFADRDPYVFLLSQEKRLQKAIAEIEQSTCLGKV